jgi:hypothetical protein
MVVVISIFEEVAPSVFKAEVKEFWKYEGWLG